MHGDREKLGLFLAEFSYFSSRIGEVCRQIPLESTVKESAMRAEDLAGRLAVRGTAGSPASRGMDSVQIGTETRRESRPAANSCHGREFRVSAEQIRGILHHCRIPGRSRIVAKANRLGSRGSPTWTRRMGRGRRAGWHGQGCFLSSGWPGICGGCAKTPGG